MYSPSGGSLGIHPINAAIENNSARTTIILEVSDISIFYHLHRLSHTQGSNHLQLGAQNLTIPYLVVLFCYSSLELGVIYKKETTMKRHQSGFTLIELMIVMAIVGILLSIFASSRYGPSTLYGYMYSKDVTGQVESVTSAMPEGALVSSTQESIFQASVMIKLSNGEFTTFSTDDRQWASLLGAKANGKCVSAKVFPYAPWQIDKAGTYYGGRLLNVKNCP